MINTNKTKWRPVRQVHGDQTRESAMRWVHRYLPAEEAEEFLASGRRFQVRFLSSCFFFIGSSYAVVCALKIVNLWRPIRHPALDIPLALCDFRSITPSEDLFPHKVQYATYERETLAVRYADKHNWKYLHGQTPEEFVLIKWYVVFGTPFAVATSQL